MKTIMNYLSYVPKQFMFGFAALALIVAPAMVFASWSPERPTYTIDEPADHVTFNSITDNPNYGDERPFHDVKDAANTSEGGFQDVMEVKDGQTLLLRAYVHNNAAANLNESGEGVAKNTKVQFLIPSDTKKNLRTISYVRADNAEPQQVSDTTDLYAAQPFSLDYVEGSATQYTNGTPNGKSLDDSIVDGGAPLTSDGASKTGEYLGCFEYASIVTVEVKVNMADLELEKTVRKSGEGSFVDSVDNVQPGDELEYKLNFTNTGDTELDDVTVGDNLPPYVTYVEDSAVVYNNNTGPEGRNIGNNIVSGGTILGDTYAPGSDANVILKAKVNENIVDERCGTVTLTNVGIVDSEDTPRVEDDADAKVDTGVPCEEPEEPVYQCDDLTANRTTIKPGQDVTFTTEATAENGAEITEYRYDFGDGSDVHVTDDAQVTHTYEEAGTYRADATVVFDVNGEQQTDSEGCAVVIKVQEQPVTPEQPEQPEQPQELPDTGPGQVLMAVAGTGALGQGVRMYVASRKKLLGSLLNR